MFGAYPLQYIGIMILVGLSGLLVRLPIMSNVFSYLILQPLISGIYSFAHIQATGEMPMFMDFFGAFTKKKYISIVLISFISAVVFMGIMAASSFIVFSEDFATVLHVREILMTPSLQSPGAMEEVGNYILLHAVDFIITFLVATIAFVPIYFMVGYSAIHLMIKGEGLLRAITTAFAVMKSAPMQVLGFVLLSYLIIALGFSLCFVGAIIAFPIVNIAFVSAFIDLEEKKAL